MRAAGGEVLPDLSFAGAREDVADRVQLVDLELELEESASLGGDPSAFEDRQRHPRTAGSAQCRPVAGGCSERLRRRARRSAAVVAGARESPLFEVRVRARFDLERRRVEELLGHEDPELVEEVGGAEAQWRRREHQHVFGERRESLTDVV